MEGLIMVVLYRVLSGERNYRNGLLVKLGMCVVLVSLIYAIVAPQLNAQEVQRVGPGDVEVGIVLGEPTGFSGKVWTTLNSAFDLGVAWSFGKGGHIHLHGDYLIHSFDFFNVETGDMPLYFGIGGRVRLEEKDSRVGLRIVVGTEYIFREAPVSIFLEIAPIMDIIPETASNLNAGFGIRYIF